MTKIDNVVTSISEQITNKYHLRELDRVITTNIWNEKECHIYYRSNEFINITAIANIDVESIYHDNLNISVMLQVSNGITCSRKELVFTNTSTDRTEKYTLTDVTNMM